MESVLRVSGVEKIFVTENGKCVQALADVSLDVGANDFICIVGPSGCGKSTLLRIIAGLERATAGCVFYHDEPIMAPHRQIGMVFQEYSLFPWRTVLDNVRAGLEFAGLTREASQRRAGEYLRLVGLEQFAQAFPHELSGGMQQRVAIARSLATEPRVLLMDEPFGALDAYTRIVLQKELLRIRELNRNTILFVTHSVDEAIFLADRILVMSTNPGRILEIIDVPMSRPRDRGNPRYGAMAAEILAKLEKETTGVIKIS
ncbi:MAG: ABC transporter ATP-binding protein [Syntrophotaleaceae bacterium]